MKSRKLIRILSHVRKDYERKIKRRGEPLDWFDVNLPDVIRSRIAIIRHRRRCARRRRRGKEVL